MGAWLLALIAISRDETHRAHGRNSDDVRQACCLALLRKHGSRPDLQSADGSLGYERLVLRNSALAAKRSDRRWSRLNGSWSPEALAVPEPSLAEPHPEAYALLASDIEGLPEPLRCVMALASRGQHVNDIALLLSLPAREVERRGWWAMLRLGAGVPHPPAHLGLVPGSVERLSGEARRTVLHWMSRASWPRAWMAHELGLTRAALGMALRRLGRDAHGPRDE